MLLGELQTRERLTSPRHAMTCPTTGSAGTGKSMVLRRILSTLAAAGTKGVYATATTGIAACQVKGSTIQQFAGIGKASGSGEEALRAVRKRPEAVRRWRAAQVAPPVSAGHRLCTASRRVGLKALGVGAPRTTAVGVVSSCVARAWCAICTGPKPSYRCASHTHPWHCAGADRR